ncbi:MAG: D-alanine--D-alanine ligase [bacterium]
MSEKIRVAVLRGGPSHEYNVSLETGKHILSLLEKSPKYQPKDIFISKGGDWHRDGLAHEPSQALLGVDVVFNALHGAYGEDGQVQEILEELGMPFTGSYSVASALAMDKEATKKVFTEKGLLVPRHELVDGSVTHDQLLYIFQNYLHPVIVKPTHGGSSIGTCLANTFQELSEAIGHALMHSKRVLVEEFIRGKEATCGVVENHRGHELYALLPIEIRKPAGSHFFDYESKYSGKSEEICPGNFTAEEKEQIEDMARRAHQMLDLRHYSRSDFMITPSSKVYILETNTLPGFTKESLLPKALQAVGWPPEDFVDHIIGLAMEGR